MAYYGLEHSGAHLPFNFHLLAVPWDAAHVRALVDEYDGSVPDDGWPNWVLGNHDQPRIASRVGNAQARVAAMRLLTLRGTPTLYYGDEIGMRNLVDSPPEQINDPRELNVPGKGLGRDPYRSPMQWSAEANAGFSSVAPWLPVAADAERCNVAVEREEPKSMLSLYRALLSLRRSRRALSVGDYRPVDVAPPLLAFERAEGEDRLLIVVNFSDRDRRFEPPSDWIGGDVLLSTLTVEEAPGRVVETMTVRVDEGLIISRPRG
jgi:alpha-glucosidase